MISRRPLRWPLGAWRRPVLALLSIVVAMAVQAGAQAQLCVQLNGAFYRQDFNALSVSGSSNISSTIPIGFAFSEAGSGNNVTYAAGDGSSSTGNTFSFGTGTNTDRAFGELNGATLQSTLGACFVNNTGLVINKFSIGYTGEQWRLGAADAVTDKLDFQFSTNATSLTEGTWTDVNTLDFVTPNNVGAGAKNGNAAENRTTKSPTAIIPTSPIAQGSTFFIRWVPTNIAGSNDGLAIDDFTILTTPTADYDLNSTVDGADLLRWQRNAVKGSGGSISQGDGNGDGAVDFLDLVFWEQFFFNAPFADSAVASAVPEPGGLSLAFAAAIGLLRARRRLVGPLPAR